MAITNEKIVIREVNETQPRGSGVSSDVVYIPGLAVTTTNVNTPLLCNSVDTFESYFGTKPYKYTEEDVLENIPGSETETFQSIGYEIGDNGYDKSYIIAKDLIQAGLSVMYENISPEAETGVNISIACDSEADVLIDSSSSTITFNPKITDENTTATYNVDVTLKSDENLYSVLLSVLGDVSVTDAEDTAKTAFALTSASITGNGTIDEHPSLTDGKTKICYKVSDSSDGYNTIRFTFTASKSSEVGYTVSFSTSDIYSSRISYLYAHLPDAIDRIKDKSIYSVKYITSGGYPAFFSKDQMSLATKMKETAYARQDAVAIIDHVFDKKAPLAITEEGSMYKKVQDSGLGSSSDATYCAMFTPYAKYSISNYGNQILPASFAYLKCLAYALKSSPNWLAVAGVSRGVVPNLVNLETPVPLSNVIAEDYQPKSGTDINKISINAITNISPYGLTIWGNRTLMNVAENGTTALNFLNTRNMISDIKKLAYSTAKSLMFEQDSDTLWLRFKSGISPLLEQLKSGNGLSNYKIIRSNTKYDGSPLTRGEIAAVIRIYPLYAVEYFDITVVVADEDVSVS